MPLKHKFVSAILRGATNLSASFRSSNILGLHEPEMVGDLSNKERERGVVAIILCTDKNIYAPIT